jgi:hypothetical protein
VIETTVFIESASIGTVILDTPENIGVTIGDEKIVVLNDNSDLIVLDPLESTAPGTIVLAPDQIGTVVIGDNATNVTISNHEVTVVGSNVPGPPGPPDPNVQSELAALLHTFQSTIYFGVSDSSCLDNDAVLALNSAFAAGHSIAVTFDATVGTYAFFVYPLSLGIPKHGNVCGLTSDGFVVSRLPVTDASGNTQDCYVLRFQNPQTGTAKISMVWP